TLFWSVWAGMAQTTNSNAAPAAVASGTTNREPLVRFVRPAPEENEVTPEWVERLAGDFPVLKTEWLGNALWKYLASLLYIFLAFYASKILDYLARAWVRRWTNRREKGFDDLVAELLSGPLKVVTFVIFLHIGLNV